MKNIFPLLILSIFTLLSCSKENSKISPTEEIDNNPTYFTFNGQIGTNDNSTIISYDNNLIITGNSNSNISLLKITKNGNQIWRTDFTGGGTSKSSSIVQIPSGEIFICGETSRNHTTLNTRYDILLVKLNSVGDTLWSKTYGGSEDDYGKNIIQTSDGNLLLSSLTYSFGAGSFGDIHLIKLDYNGDTLWTKTYNDPDQEVPFHLMETNNGEYLISGTNEDNSNPRELYLLKVNSNGTKLWDKKIGPATWKWGFSTIELTNGDLITCGRHTSNGYSQILLVKTDNLGNVIWEKEYGNNTLSEEGKSIKQSADGTYIITGSSFDVLSGLTGILLLKVDQNGNQVWLKTFGENSNNGGFNILKDSNGDNIITGNYNGNIFMAKTNDNGDFK